MKTFLKIFFVFLAAALGAFLFAPSVGSVLLAAPAIVLDTQRIVFLTSLKEEYEKIDTWLSEAEDLSSFAADGQTLVFPEAGAAPKVYKNRTTDVDEVEPTETVHKVSLDVYDSQNYKIRNINMHALPFDKIQHYTRKSADSIVKQEVEDAAHAFAPEQAGNKVIVLPTTGAVNAQGVKAMTLDDIVTLARECDSEQFPDEGRNIVLPADMWWDLVTNNPILKGQIERQPNTGIIEPKVVNYYGFKIHKSTQKLGLGYDTSQNKKAPQGTVITGNIVPAAFLFVASEVFRVSGEFLMFNKDLHQNTSGRAYEFGFQHRFKADHQMKGSRYSGLIYQAK